VESSTGGDLSIQACADDQQIAFHAVRQLARLAYDQVEIRWVQSGFLANPTAKGTPRNLMGFKDGTGNVRGAADIDKFVWVGAEGPAWMQGGSYVVTRRSRIALEHWDRTHVGFQEQTIGRHKLSGAPLGAKGEFDPVTFDKNDADGNPVIPENSHLSLANSANNDGARVLRRSYSYNDGITMVAERWPPWKQGMEYDAGLLFICYQRDPRTGFVRIFERMSKFDMLNQFVTNIGGALFACPRGAAPGAFIGQGLFV
jgi:deferrochelatase/peroxidase EfeB